MSADLKRLRTAIMIFWPLFGVVSSIIAIPAGGRFLAGRFVARSLSWGMMALFTPLIVALAQRYSLRRRRVRAVFVHLGAAFVVTAAHVVVAAALYRLANRGLGMLSNMMGLWSAVLKRDLIAYFAVAVAVWVVQHKRRAHRAEVAKARLERRLAEGSWEAMRRGIEPAALFAAFDAIEADLARGVQAAEERIEQLCRNLRERLEAIRKPVDPPAAPRFAPAPPPYRVWLAAALLYPLFGIALNVFFMTVDMLTGQSMVTFQQRVNTVLLTYILGGALSFAVVAATKAAPRLAAAYATAAVVAACFFHAFSVEAATNHFHLLGEPTLPGTSFDTMAILSAGVAYVVRFDEFERKKNASRVESHALARSIHEARMQSLSRAVAPHFLFNTLNSILALVRRDAASAALMLDRLRGLLHVSLAADTPHMVPLREELAATNGYLDIERIRFRDALCVHYDVDPALLDARVPSFFLQPLVENAVRHGVLGATGRGDIRVAAQARGGRLRVTVENEAHPFDVEEWREGIGLAAVRARLASIYGRDHQLTVSLGEHVNVCLEIPLEERP